MSSRVYHFLSLYSGFLHSLLRERLVWFILKVSITNRKSNAGLKKSCKQFVNNLFGIIPAINNANLMVSGSEKNYRWRAVFQVSLSCCSEFLYPEQGDEMNTNVSERGTRHRNSRLLTEHKTTTWSTTDIVRTSSDSQGHALIENFSWESIWRL